MSLILIGDAEYRILFMSGGPVSWQSCMQSTVALSRIEAEYMAASAATQEALWQARLLQQLGMRIFANA